MTIRIALSAVLATLFVPSALGQTANPRLTALVGTNNAFVISLRDASGNAVTHLDPGTYDIAVSDRSETHNFHLKGPAVDNMTQIAAIEDVTWTVTLGDGRFGFVCDAHATTMRGYFTVGTLAPSRLTASVGPTKRISLTPKTAQVGPAAISVNDRSRTDNFHLVGPGVNRKTGVAARTRATWNVTLRPGTYTYRSDKTRRLRGSFTVRFPA